jgi:hypothetical protein
MRKQIVFWKPIQSRNRAGEVYINHYFPQLIDSAYRSELLAAILSMEPGTPISFENAVNLAKDAFYRASDAGQIGRKPGQSHWYYINFLKFISDQGFSIELSGDEFETASICSVVA